MRLSLERELDLHADEEILVPKNEPQDVEKPLVEDHEVAETNQAEKLRAKWAEGVHVAIPLGVRWGDVQE